MDGVDAAQVQFIDGVKKESINEFDTIKPADLVEATGEDDDHVGRMRERTGYSSDEMLIVDFCGMG